MGASSWSYFVRYHADLQAVLDRLRRRVYRRGAYYKIPRPTRSELKAQIERATRDLAEVAKAPYDDADRETLVPIFREQIEQARSALKKPATRVPRPKNIDAAIADLMKRNGEGGTHSILDVSRITARPAFGCVAPLSSKDVVEMFGTLTPSHAAVADQVDEIVDLRSRNEGTYVLVYGADQKPKQILFAGCSGD